MFLFINFIVDNNIFIMIKINERTDKLKLLFLSDLVII